MTHKTMTFGLCKRVLSGAALAAVVTVAVACSNTGGKTDTEGSGGAAGGQAGTPRMTIAMITHGVPGDEFWTIVQKGAEAAAAKDNVELRYNADPDATQQATLVQNAIDSKVDGIALTLAKPDAMAGGIGAAEAAGIPVVGFNSGVNDWQKLGVQSFFGLDIKGSGVMSAEELVKAGAKHGICVIQEQGQVALEEMCQGAKEGFTSGTMNVLYVNGADTPSVESTLTAKLQQDPNIDGIVTLGNGIALAGENSLKTTGSKAKMTTLNLTKDIVPLIKDGTIVATIDQQGWLQGYLAVDSLWVYKNNTNVLGGGQPVLTGPTLVNKDNIDKIAPFIDKGTR
jgi:ABC-type sugar transport system substrate-binding protein